MKTLKLKLKQDVFIVDTNAPIQAIEIDDYVFLCKGSELTEEIASELVETHKNCRRYIDYNIKERNRFFDLSIPSFISAVESKGFHWLENPVEKPKLKDEFGNKGSYNYEWELEQWQEAEEKTFKNPLIFVNK